MTEIEEKALALVNEVREGRPYSIDEAKREYGWCFQAVCIAIGRDEAFRQEVSDELLAWFGEYELKVPGEFARFIIAKPDPLVEALHHAGFSQLDIGRVEAAIEKRGGKIVWEDK